MPYDAERADARALDQLEAILRTVAEELAGWRARALKAEGDAGARGGGARHEIEARSARGAGPELEAENRLLRQRVEAARSRVSDLVSRLNFLEEQVREQSGDAGGLRR